MKMYKKQPIKASNKPAPMKRAIKADEYYPENYADMGYEGLDSAIDALYNLRRNAVDLINQIDTYMDGEFKEMFAGPDDAYYFAEKVGEISDTVAQCERDFYDLI